jgi:hypothetical protein
VKTSVIKIFKCGTKLCDNNFIAYKYSSSHSSYIKWDLGYCIVIDFSGISQENNLISCGVSRRIRRISRRRVRRISWSWILGLVSGFGITWFGISWLWV